MAYFVHGRICCINRPKITRPVFQRFFRQRHSVDQVSKLVVRTMVNKCAVVNCRTGYKFKKRESSFLLASKAVFSFPKDTSLEEKWIKFVNRKDWKPSKHLVICMDHFEEKYLKYGKRVTLKHELKPVPSIYSEETCIPSSVMPKVSNFRKPPTKRDCTIPDEIHSFQEMDKIKNIDMLHESDSPNGFSFQRYESFVLYYRLFLVDSTPFIESISVDNNLHVKLHYKSCPLPLPHWFRTINNCKLTSLSILDNLVSYMHNLVEGNSYYLVNELSKLIIFKFKGRPQYSLKVLRFALMQRYSSSQAYLHLLEQLPLPSKSLLKKLVSGGIDSIKSLKLLLNEDKISNNYVILF